MLIGCYLLIEFTEYEPSGAQKYLIGWCLTGIMALTTLANVLCMIFKVISVLAVKINQRCQKNKKARIDINNQMNIITKQGVSSYSSTNNP